MAGESNGERERDIHLPHVRLAALEWGAAGGVPVLALHGWLDNAATFTGVGPLLDGLHLVAPDLVGHGRSDHRPAGTPFHFVDWVEVVLDAADALGWDRFALLGHSMGAGIATLAAAVAGDRVTRLALLEGFGPLSAPAEGAAERFARALADERRWIRSEPRTFRDLEAGAAARMRGTELDRAAAGRLVERGTVPSDGGVRVAHDLRLRGRSRLRMTEEQVRDFLAAIRCPVLAVRARDGWPFPAEQVAARLAVVADLRVHEVDGGHHVHLVHPERVAPLLQGFLVASRQDPPASSS